MRLCRFELPDPVAELAATGGIVDSATTVVKRAKLSPMRRTHADTELAHVRNRPSVYIDSAVTGITLWRHRQGRGCGAAQWGVTKAPSRHVRGFTRSRQPGKRSRVPSEIGCELAMAHNLAD